MVRTCKTCGAEKPLEDFVLHRQCEHGHTHECKLCYRARAQRWRDAHRKPPKAVPPPPATRTCRRCDTTKPLDDFRRTQRGFYGRGYTCKACDNARHSELIFADAERHEREKARSREKSQRRREANPELVNFWVNEQKVKAKGCKIVERVNALVLLEMDDGVCGICGEDVDPFDFEVDHIVPLSAGGEHSYANTQPAHRACNMAKGNKVLAYG